MPDLGRPVQAVSMAVANLVKVSYILKLKLLCNNLLIFLQICYLYIGGERNN